MTRRRTVVWVGAGAAAAAAGLGWQRWRSPPAADLPVADLPAAADPQAAGGLWQMRFATPDGGELVMATLQGKPLVLNFWATWCPPCVKEMPELDRFARQFAASRGGHVVGLAVDSPTPVREFLKRAPVSYAVALAGMDGTDLSRTLGNTSGALPFTAVFNRAGQPVRHRLGETNFDELTRWVQDL